MKAPRSWLSLELKRNTALLLVAPVLAWSQTPPPQASPPKTPAIESRLSPRLSSLARKDLGACRAHEVTDFPGSPHFASDFIETMATDPDPHVAFRSDDPETIFALTADLGTDVSSRDQAIYLSKSTNDGETWTPIVRLDPRYFDAQISEGLRNGLAVTPGATDFVITTQDGAFQVLPQRDPNAPIVRPIPGPRVPPVRPGSITITKKEGEPVRAGVVLITADGQHMIVGYGYFDNNPQLFTYHRDPHGFPYDSWIEDGKLPHLPTNLDIFSMQFDDPANPHPGWLYVGTGDQAYRLDLNTLQWTQVSGVGPDSAIHSMSTLGGLHIAACWGVYNPVSPDSVQRVTNAKFLLHRGKDQVGPNIRAYAITVDPLRPDRVVLSAITGVYVSSDSGQTWKRLNDLPEGEFHSARFNPDGTVIVSGFVGTFLVNPFSNACKPRLKTRANKSTF
jgi:hypothetical protein